MIKEIAFECGFFERKRKISPYGFIFGFMYMLSNKVNTYTALAEAISWIDGKAITKQAIWERMTDKTEKFIKKLLEEKIKEKIQSFVSRQFQRKIKKFNNIVIEDSTVFKLPDKLVSEFPGNVVNGKRKSQFKIHAIYNLTENDFYCLDIHSYAENDQSLSLKSMNYLRAGDLCIRDLGFFTLDAVSKFNELGAYYISKKLFQLSVYNIKTGKKINLLKYLKKRKIIDEWVLIGSEKQVKVRLIALPVPEKVAQERRRKAKKDRNKRTNHSKEYYDLLGYNIFITNIPTDMCSAKEIVEMYGLRWNIEIIFKSWKSCFSFEGLFHHQCTNVTRVKCLIYILLLYIYLFQVVWWRYCVNMINGDKEEVELSILKMANFFIQNFSRLMEEDRKKLTKEIIEKLCKHEKRKDRENMAKLRYKLVS